MARNLKCSVWLDGKLVEEFTQKNAVLGLGGHCEEAVETAADYKWMNARYNSNCDWVFRRCGPVGVDIRRKQWKAPVGNYWGTVRSKHGRFRFRARFEVL